MRLIWSYPHFECYLHSVCGSLRLTDVSLAAVDQLPFEERRDDQWLVRLTRWPPYTSTASFVEFPTERRSPTFQKYRIVPPGCGPPLLLRM